MGVRSKTEENGGNGNEEIVIAKVGQRMDGDARARRLLCKHIIIVGGF
jgi:hypothetical protein